MASAPSARRARIDLVFWLMAESWRSSPPPSETAWCPSRRACPLLWMDPAVLSNTFIAPSMLYSSVIDLLLGGVHGVDGLELTELADLALDPLLFDLELAPRVVPPRFRGFVGRHGPFRRRPRLDLELQGPARQLLVALLQRLLRLPLEILDAAVVHVLLALGLHLERDGAGRRFAQAAEVSASRVDSSIVGTWFSSRGSAEDGPKNRPMRVNMLASKGPRIARGQAD